MAEFMFSYLQIALLGLATNNLTNRGTTYEGKVHYLDLKFIVD